MKKLNLRNNWQSYLLEQQLLEVTKKIKDERLRRQKTAAALRRKKDKEVFAESDTALRQEVKKLHRNYHVTEKLPDEALPQYYQNANALGISLDISLSSAEESNLYDFIAAKEPDPLHWCIYKETFQRITKWLSSHFEENEIEWLLRLTNYEECDIDLPQLMVIKVKIENSREGATRLLLSI